MASPNKGLNNFNRIELHYWIIVKNERGHAVAQLVEALRLKSEGRGFDSRLCHWNFSFT